MTTTIKQTPEFEKKKLATHGVNVGLKCGHGCSYCFTPALIRTHCVFKEIGRSPYEENYSIVDPTIVHRIKNDVKKVGPNDTVMVCSYTDAWAPESKRFNLGRKVLETLLKDGNSNVRILTKNTAVEEEFEFLRKYSDRVKVGLSITSPPNKTAMAKVEPYASTNQERVATLIKAHESGLKTYAMVCPCLPEISSPPSALKNIFSSIMPADPEDIWLEPINARGPALKATSEIFEKNKYHAVARAINYIRNQNNWSKYATRLTMNALDITRSMGIENKLHVLLYGKSFHEKDVSSLKNKDKANRIVWL
jgi:DNA repair photolyase